MTGITEESKMTPKAIGGKVLVVDDQKELRNILKHVCEEVGLEVFMAENGREAFRIAVEKKFDLMLLDIMMPQWTGVDAVKALERIAMNPKVIVVSGFINEKYRKQLEGLKCIKGIVRKPFEIVELQDLIRRTLDKEEEVHLETNG